MTFLSMPEASGCAVAHMNSIELYTFAMVIIAVITLVVTIKRE